MRNSLVKSGVCAAAILPFSALFFSAQADTPILHPVEAYCIDYEIGGDMQGGSVKRCHRKNGYEQFEIQNTTISVFGISQSTNQHIVTIGDQIYSINLDTNTGTITTNPFYASLSQALDDTSPEQMGAAFLDAMGYTATGETKIVAEASCEVYNSAMVGTVCLSDDLLMLEQNVMGMTWTAVTVAIGVPGDDADYRRYESAEMSDGPDLSNLGAFTGAVPPQ